MLSLSPRYDLFKFSLPKDFLPVEIEEKYTNILNKNAAVISTPIDYLNESIQGVSFPAISDINVVQEQHGSNDIKRSNSGGLGKMNVEPKHDILHVTSENPLEKISKEFKVTFRLNQGFYNYFMIYETIFYKICKPLRNGPIPVLYIDLMDGSGKVNARVKFIDCYIDGIDGLEFDYSKVERNAGTFDITFKFNNIDFDLV
jgi:hypothetical protein